MQTQQRTHCPIFTQSHLHCFVEITSQRKVSRDPKDDQIHLVTMTIVCWVIILRTSYFGDIRTWSLPAGQPFYSEDDDLYFSGEIPRIFVEQIQQNKTIHFYIEASTCSLLAQFPCWIFLTRCAHYFRYFDSKMSDDWCGPRAGCSNQINH